MRTGLILACAIGLTCGCVPKPPQRPADLHVEVVSGPDALGEVRTGVTHVVLCWLNNPGDAAARKRIIDTSYSFTSIPGVRMVSAGEALPSNRAVVDSSFDVAVMMVFDTVESLRAYERNPLHQRAVAETLRPVTKRMVVYDFINGRK